MAVMEDPTYTLDWRFLSEADQPWVGRFSCGGEWWSQEVTAFLREDALTHAAEGLNQTILFSFRGERDLVGFVTIASDGLKLTEVQGVVSVSTSVPGGRLPAAVIPYFGVAQALRGNGIGREMHTQVLRQVTEQWAAARVLYLQCWQENEAGIRFWRRLGYEEFAVRPREGPDKAKHLLVFMLFDRFRLPSAPGAL